MHDSSITRSLLLGALSLALLAGALLPIEAEAQPPINAPRIGAMAWESATPVPGREIRGVKAVVPVHLGDGTVEFRVETYDGTQPLDNVIIVFDLKLLQWQIDVMDLIDRPFDPPVTVPFDVTPVRKRFRVRTGPDGRGSKRVNIKKAMGRFDDPDKPMLLSAEARIRGDQKVGRFYGEAQPLPD